MGLEVIQKLKKEKGLTTEALSKLSGVPIGTLNKILNGETKDPKLETLKAIARVLECTLDDFDDLDKQSVSFFVDKHDFRNSELEIIEKYRSLDSHGKEMVDIVIDKEYDRCQSEEQEYVAIPMEELREIPLTQRLQIEQYVDEEGMLRVARVPGSRRRKDGEK